VLESESLNNALRNRDASITVLRRELRASADLRADWEATERRLREEISEMKARMDLDAVDSDVSPVLKKEHYRHFRR
jgi:transposase